MGQRECVGGKREWFGHGWRPKSGMVRGLARRQKVRRETDERMAETAASRSAAFDGKACGSRTCGRLASRVQGCFRRGKRLSWRTRARGGVSPKFPAESANRPVNLKIAVGRPESGRRPLFSKENKNLSSGLLPRFFGETVRGKGENADSDGSQVPRSGFLHLQRPLFSTFSFSRQTLCGIPGR